MLTFYCALAEQLSMLAVQVDMKNRLEVMERMLTSILRALKPSQKIIVPRELPSLPLTTLDLFEKNETFLNNSSDRTDTVSDQMSNILNSHYYL